VSNINDAERQGLARPIENEKKAATPLSEGSVAGVSPAERRGLGQSPINKKIAIHKNDKIFKHFGIWNDYIIESCEKLGLDYDVVDCYKNGFIHQMRNYDYLFFPPDNHVLADKIAASNILEVAHRQGLKVFPNFDTIWHFDDKIAEEYAFQSVNALTPNCWIFFLLDECLEWLNNEATYPIIAKLRCGSGSNGVTLLRDSTQATKYAKAMFSKGLDPSPSLMYKAYSKAQSSRSLKTILSRIKKIPTFLNTRRHAKMLSREKGYCYFQEFIPNDGYDIKIVVIGDKLSFFARKVRKGDFRASGGGDVMYDRKLVTKQIIDSAFYVADKLGLQSVGFDYVVNKNTGEGLIIEMCYGFDWRLLYDAGGHFTRDGIWFDEPINAPEEIVKNLVMV